VGNLNLMMVEEQRCPRCGIKRTVQLSTWGRFCFNCRTRFGLSVAEWPQRLVRTEKPEYGFSPDELLRLEHYRAAIAAAFFTEWPELSYSTKRTG
jgi:hypothetical protein